MFQLVRRAVGRRKSDFVRLYTSIFAVAWIVVFAACRLNASPLACVAVELLATIKKEAVEHPIGNPSHR
jgi:hypothetical protein